MGYCISVRCSRISHVIFTPPPPLRGAYFWVESTDFTQWVPQRIMKQMITKRRIIVPSRFPFLTVCVCFFWFFFGVMKKMMVSTIPGQSNFFSNDEISSVKLGKVRVCQRKIFRNV